LIVSFEAAAATKTVTRTILSLSELASAVKFTLRGALNHSTDKTSLVAPKAFLPLDDFGRNAVFSGESPKDHWQEVAAIRIDVVGWATLATHGCYLLAHLVWVVWTWILYELNQPVSSSQFIQIYLKTNIAKYLPGNVWHYYGRITAAKTAGVSGSAATERVAGTATDGSCRLGNGLTRYPVCSNEPCHFTGIANTRFGYRWWFIPGFKRGNSLSRPIKVKATASSSTVDASVGLRRYPLRPLLGG